MQLQTSFIVCYLITISAARHKADNGNKEDRRGKFFGIFNIVSFPNDVCNGTNDMQGVCLSSRECSDKGGEVSGTCAAGFGTCCAFISRSDSGMGMTTFDTKVAYIQNPDYPQDHDDALMQTIQLVPKNENICQIRLDFLEFQTDGGSIIDKQCDRDMFRVSGSGGLDLGVGDLCGKNTGQHLYVPVQGSRGGPANIRILTAARMNGNFSEGFKWNVKVTQLDCTDPKDLPLIAPPGCTQYHKGQAGKISSFNFDGQGQNQYGKNLKYTICLERPSTACEVKYSRDSMISAYRMSVGKANPSKKYEKCETGSGNSDNGCSVEECIRGGDDPKERSGDYLMITGGIYTKTEKDNPVEHFRNDYFCGTGLGEDSVVDGTDSGRGVFTQASGPVAIRFVTDEFPGEAKGTGTKPEEKIIKDELGWSLRYSFFGSCTTVNNKKP